MNARITIAIACLLGVLCKSAGAYALQDYADEIQRELALPDKPSCTFCHARDEDGVATDTLFNDALKDRGFSRRKGLPSLRTALATLDDQEIDSDGDGVGDVNELRAGANPNDETDAGMAVASCAVTGVGARAACFSTLLWLISALVGLRVGTGSQRARRRSTDRMPT